MRTEWRQGLITQVCIIAFVEVSILIHLVIPQNPRPAPAQPELADQAPDPQLPGALEPQVIHLGWQKFLILFGIVVLILFGVLGILCSILLLSVGITFYPSVVQNSLTILGLFCVLGFLTCTCSFFVTCLVGFSFIVFLDQGDNDRPRETIASRSGLVFYKRTRRSDRDGSEWKKDY